MPENRPLAIRVNAHGHAADDSLRSAVFGQLGVDQPRHSPGMHAFIEWLQHRQPNLLSGLRIAFPNVLRNLS